MCHTPFHYLANTVTPHCNSNTNTQQIPVTVFVISILNLNYVFVEKNDSFINMILYTFKELKGYLWENCICTQSVTVTVSVSIKL